MIKAPAQSDDENTNCGNQIIYILTIKRSRTRGLRNTFFVFFFLHALLFTATVLRLHATVSQVYAIVGVIGCVILAWYNRRAYGMIANDIFQMAVIIFTGGLWFVLEQYILGLSVLLLFLLQTVTATSHNVKVSSSGISYPALFHNKNLYWSDLENVVLKDGLFTIDKIDNKIIQFYIENVNGENLNECVFNNVCREFLGARLRS